MSTLIIDRIEGDLAVLEREDGSTYAVSRDSLPTGAAAGDVLREQNGRLVPDPDETANRRDMAFSLEQKLKQKFSR